MDILPHGEKADEERSQGGLAEEAGHDGDCELEIGDWGWKQAFEEP